jgi:TRAP transporter TAXI family solute receptor
MRAMLTRRTALAGAIAGGTGLAVSAGLPLASWAQDITFHRIGTGGTAGTYFPIGGLIANAISNPPGSRPCADGGSCGVSGLVATAVATAGSVANVQGIANGTLQSGFVQSDVAYWAFTGTAIYDQRPKVEGLRAISNLYPESLHLVVRKASGIRSVADLKGKRVSLDEPGSGTLVDARLILAAFGVAEKDIKAEYLKVQQASDKLKDGTLDAFFNVSGWPQAAIAELAVSAGIDLVPIEGPEVDALLRQFAFFSRDEVPDFAYRNVEGVRTVSVHAIWLTSVLQPDELINAITAALWSSHTRKLLDSGHAKGKIIRLETALEGIGIPLHPGAEKFYKEKGISR